MDLSPYYEEQGIKPGEYYKVRYVKRNNESNHNIPPHYSHGYECIIYKNIKCKLNINNYYINISNNQALLIPPYIVHGFDVSKGDHDYYIIHFLHDKAINLFQKEFYLPKTPIILNLENINIPLIYTLLDHLSSNQTSISQDIFSLFISWLCNKCSLQQNNINIDYTNDNQRFISLLKYLDEKEIYTMRSKEAAKFLNISASHFFALFKNHFGKTFSFFMKERQLSQAKYLLTTTDLPITQIAQALSFCDSAYFTSVFKNKFNQTPRDFRKKYHIPSK